MSHANIFMPPRLTDWAESVRNDTAPLWLVDQLLPADNLVLISGEPKGARKTWLAMWLALVAAQNGHKVAYCYREGARSPTLQRFDCLAAGNQIDRSAYDNIYFHHRGLFFLDDLEQVKHAAKFVKREGIKLFFIDTFAKSMSSDENSSKDVGKAINSAERLRDSGATVVLVHHLRKAASALSSGTTGTPEPDKDLRGSSALAGAYETHLAIRSYGGKSAILLCGGKESELSARSYEYNFQKDGLGNLTAVSIKLSLLPEVPYVEGND